MRSFLRRASIWARIRIERRLAPRANRRRTALYNDDRLAVLARVDAAITRGVAWLEPQADVSMSVLLCADRTLTRTGDTRFEFVHEKTEHYRTTLRDPAMRVVLRDYDPSSPEYADLPDIMDVRPYYPVELLMIDTLYAHETGQSDILERLIAFDDDGFYGTTHIVVGGLILLETGGAPEADVRRAMSDTVPSIVRQNQSTLRADDIFAERIMVLYWMNLPDLIGPAWIMRLVEAQMPDGGWATHNMPPVGQSNQHTTIVALAALAEFLAVERAARDG